MKFIKENNCFQISGNKLFCNNCNETKEYVSKQELRNLKKHHPTKKHEDSIARKNEQTRLSLFNTGDQSKNLHFELLDAFILPNIPIYKLESTLLKNFQGIKSKCQYRIEILY